MIALWILAVVAVLIVILLMLPAGVSVFYDEQRTLVRVQVAWIRFVVYPRPAEKPTDKKKTAKSQKTGQNKPAPKPGMRNIQDFRPFVSLALELADSLRRRVVVKFLKIHVRYGGKDAAEAAIHYGRAWAILGTVTPLLAAAVEIQKEDIQAIYQENTNAMTVMLEAVLTLRIGQCLALAFRYGLRGLKIVVEWKRRKEKSA